MARPFASRNVGREAWRHRVRRPGAVVVLASGGLDSCVLLAEQARRGREVFPLAIKSGLVWEAAERACLRRFLAALGPDLARNIQPLETLAVPAGDLYGDHWSRTGRGTPGWKAADNAVYLPGRNILLLSKAAVYAALRGIPRVAVAPLKGNTFPDTTPEFFRSFERALAEGLDFPLSLEAPFLAHDKEGVIRLGARLPLDLTMSCSRPAGRRHCGACAKCRERILAFRAAGVADPATRHLSRKESAR